MSKSHSAAARLRARVCVAEAMLLLVVARLLIQWVPMRLWRSTLGHPGPLRPQLPEERSRRISLAVRQAAGRLPGNYVCLPQAMAVQWMLRRRGTASALVFGAHGGGDRPALHAWVEAGGRIVIGEDRARTYATGLTLVQP